MHVVVHFLWWANAIFNDDPGSWVAASRISRPWIGVAKSSPRQAGYAPYELPGWGRRIETRRARTGRSRARWIARTLRKQLLLAHHSSRLSLRSQCQAWIHSRRARQAPSMKPWRRQPRTRPIPRTSAGRLAKSRTEPRLSVSVSPIRKQSPMEAPITAICRPPSVPATGHLWLMVPTACRIARLSWRAMRLLRMSHR